MKTCQKCNSDIPTYIYVNDVRRNLCKRKYCLSCSPFGGKNRKKLNGESRKDQREHKCECGETNPDKFYGNKRSICGKCHNQYTIKVGQEKRKKGIDLLGGKCLLCGYSKYCGSLDFHHVSPEVKDDKFDQMRGWSWSRIQKELENCVLLCRNCHGEVHAGVSKIPAEIP